VVQRLELVGTNLVVDDEVAAAAGKLVESHYFDSVRLAIHRSCSISCPGAPEEGAELQFLERSQRNNVRLHCFAARNTPTTEHFSGLRPAGLLREDSAPTVGPSLPFCATRGSTACRLC